MNYDKSHMELLDFNKLLRRKKSTIFTLVFLVLILTLAVSLINPLKYGAKSRLLVIQNTTGTDPYTVSKSNEYLGNLFSQVAYSSSFFDFVLNSNYNVDKNYFSGSYNQQLKLWQKTVQTKTLSDTGIIEVMVYHPDPYQAQQIALAVNDVLINKNFNYQGNGDGIKVNIIDQPLVSTYPIKPNLPENLAVALAASLLFSLFYIYLFPEERYNLRLWPKRKRRTVRIGDQTGREGSDRRIEYRPIENQNIPYQPGNDYQSSNRNQANFRPQGNIDNILR